MDLKGVAGDRVDEFAIDEAFFDEEGRVFELGDCMHAGYEAERLCRFGYGIWKLGAGTEEERAHGERHGRKRREEKSFMSLS